MVKKKTAPKAKPTKKTEKPQRKPGQPLADPLRERYAGQRAMGFSQSAAYRNANPDAKKRSAGSVKTMASRLEADPDVQERKKEILADMLHSNDALLTKEQLAELICDELREAHKEPGALAAASGLVDKYCKMFGFYEPEKHNVKIGCLDEDGRNAKIAALLKVN